MTPLLDLAIRSSAILAAGLVFDLAMRSRAAALRHFVLAAALAGAVAVVPLSMVMPVWEVPIASSAPTRAAAVAQPAPTTMTTASGSPLPQHVSAERSAAQPPWLALAWFGGFAVAASSLFAGVYRLSRVSRRGRRSDDADWNAMARRIAASYGITRDVALVETGAPDLLATWGLLRPSVLLPSHARGWSRDRMHVVLCHELAHIRRHDWAVQMSAEALRTVLWFNPLIWMICTRLRRAGEQACDDAVLGRGVPPRDYASHLLELARRCRPGSRWASVVPMAHPSTLERRIVAMLNPGLNRQVLSTRAAVLTAAVLLAITLPVAALRAGQAPPTYFSGAIYDTTGAVMPGVSLTLEDAAQGKQTAVSDAAGRFQFASVAPGKYVLSAELPGFRALRQELELRNARDWDKAITLQVGTLSETISVRSTRMTAPATAVRPQAPAPVRVGGNIRVPRKLHDVKPVYPDSMRAAGRDGVVSLDAIIAEDGSVSSVRVISGDVHPDFAVAAVDAVRQWRFSPTLLNGRPVEVVMTVKVGFSLEN